MFKKNYFLGFSASESETEYFNTEIESNQIIEKQIEHQYYQIKKLYLGLEKLHENLLKVYGFKSLQMEQERDNCKIQ